MGDRTNVEGAKWDGVSEVILGKREWFDAWMEGEMKCEFTEVSLSTELYLISL